MHIFYILSALITIASQELSASLAINKVVVRIPKENDIGLIFDLFVVNTDTVKKEMLEFRIRSDGTCVLNLTESKDEIMEDASRIVGGNFGYIEAGAMETVSLIWPTVSLYNRVGSCPITITATNAINNEQKQIRQTLHFDTRFTTLDPEAHSLRKHKFYNDCRNWDKDYLQNCTPVNCEERYFGRRSFYNYKSERCEQVPRCAESYELYDIFANECINTRNFCSEDDIQRIREGMFDDKILDLRESPVRRNQPNIDINNLNSAFDADKVNNILQQQPHAVKVESSVMGNDNAMLVDSKLVTASDWLKGLTNGLLIVLVSITIYALICFVIFLIVSWISRRHNNNDKGNNMKCLISSPASSENTIYTTSSLLSQR